MAQTVALNATTSARRWGPFGLAAAASMATMSLTAMWFLLVGGALLVAGLLSAVVRPHRRMSTATLVGLGLLAGPAIYISLAALPSH